MLILLLTFLVIIVDQAAKYYIQAHMLPGMSIPVIPGIFHITYVLNPGAAFGIMEHQTVFFIIAALGLLIAAVYFYPRIPRQGYRLMRFGVGLMAGGAVGNVIDRVKTGYVVDFFDFRIWPVFNMADIAIVTGVICILVNLVFMPNLKKDEVS
ncbi:peptidase a8 signal peptidase ii [Lucifera butyrica]|uniref:Lipoprotein signal peptidase n=1 Tax=Lucifera butyrica TaxID=1351585 RepID=A0A498R433_9FIRM|nr:signal peptidase II [Lucifera butyrica]VBB06174.1 peptidase a8 signal peptidase ii [Lucifera butyrica]